MDNTKTNPDSHLANYTPNDPTCPICKKAVEPQHTPARDQVTSTIGHDYCLRIETPEQRAARAKAALKIVSLSAGEVERVGFVQPANTERRKVWGNGVYHYELRPAGYRTQYEREIEAEALVSDAERS